ARLDLGVHGHGDAVRDNDPQLADAHARLDGRRALDGGEVDLEVADAELVLRLDVRERGRGVRVVADAVAERDVEPGERRRNGDRGRDDEHHDDAQPGDGQLAGPALAGDEQDDQADDRDDPGRALTRPGADV